VVSRGAVWQYPRWLGGLWFSDIYPCAV